MARYSITIFLGAFLLFQLQPLMGKYVLPWFGGGPAVWTACMLFFQVVLLAGYAYAHFISSRLTPQRLATLHLVLLGVSLAMLPIVPNAEFWKPVDGSMPVLRIVLLLAGTIGLPYFLLSSTGPLLQESFHRETGRPPYRLYSLSNAGSLLALLTYPFVFEPRLALWTQGIAWSVGYALFALLCGWCVWRMRSLPTLPPQVERRIALDAKRAAKPERGQILLWLALAACGSVMLLATTNQMGLEIPSVPFLWVLPLALYLLSFIICFDHDRWYHRGVFWPLLAVGLGLAGYALFQGHHLLLWQQLMIYPATMFVCCMVCHGELVRSKPAPSYSTLFYLTVSAGGALGGILVAIIAPLAFREFWEYQIGLVATVALALLAVLVYWDPKKHAPRWAWAAGGVTVMALVVGAVLCSQRKIPEGTVKTPVATLRDFYGVLRISDNENPQDPNGSWRLLQHGNIDHGLQYHDPEISKRLSSYYVPKSGVGLALAHHPRRFADNPAKRSLRIGVVGLGAGTLAAAGEPGDTVTFYEINPEVVKVANEYFTYLRDAKADVEIIVGDARIQMERQLAEGRPQQFDVLIIDAFSSDSIPVHLLTLEGVKLYGEHMKADGILCLHISNLYLELSAVVRGIAEELECPSVLIETFPEYRTGAYFSIWGLLTRNERFLNDPTVVAAAQATRPYPHPLVLWTDDYASLWQVVRDYGPLLGPLFPGQN